MFIWSMFENGAGGNIWSVFENRVQRVLSGACLRVVC